MTNKLGMTQEQQRLFLEPIVKFMQKIRIYLTKPEANEMKLEQQVLPQDLELAKSLLNKVRNYKLNQKHVQLMAHSHRDKGNHTFAIECIREMVDWLEREREATQQLSDLYRKKQECERTGVVVRKMREVGIPEKVVEVVWK